MSTATESTLAQEPFDDAQADFVLRSSDNVPVDFRVSKVILSVASTMFADMFDIASKEPGDDTPMVTVSENSEALDLFLRHIYPVRSPKVTHIRQMEKLAKFAHKYRVEALEEVVERHLVNTIPSDPVGIYVIAVTYGYKDIGKAAARASLNISFSELSPQDLQYAPAELELLRYHVACGEAASAVASSLTWFPSNKTGLTVDLCEECRTLDSARPRKERYGPSGVWDYVHRSAVVLARHPAADTITTLDFILEGFDCPDCPLTLSKTMRRFSQIFAKAIAKVVAQVPLPSSLSTP